MARARAASDADDIVVADASYASIWVANYLTALRARHALPDAARHRRARLGPADGARRQAGGAGRAGSFCLVGDGGFAHVWSELETARRHGIAVVLTVLNNQILGYQKHAEDVLFGAHTSAVRLRAGRPRRHRARLRPARACASSGRPTTPPPWKRRRGAPATTLIDVITDPDAYPPITLYEGKLPDPLAASKGDAECS